MAIDPYEPELAKRRMTFELAHTQLTNLMNDLRRMGPEFRVNVLNLDEALKDYRDAGKSLAEWIEQKHGSQKEQQSMPSIGHPRPCPPGICF